VYWASAGRSEETRVRASAAGLQDGGSVKQMCEFCAVLVSVCPPEFAEDVAREVAGHSFRGLFLDANAISPERARRIGESITAQGGRFVDGCIIGLPAKSRGQTWLYISGAEAESALPLFCGGPLEAEVLGAEIGQASALKMCFAAQSKGNAALLAAVVGAAESLGVRAALERQWARSGPNWERVVSSIQHTAPKAWRFVAEMQEIADAFEAAGVPGGFPGAAKEVYSRMARFKGAERPEFEQVVRSLISFR
jgi:3-hydroxyisobutyrate dehydrogenase-like beta-hydroxyacid dehydrogenase